MLGVRRVRESTVRRNFDWRSGLIGALLMVVALATVPATADIGDAIILGSRNLGSAETELQGRQPGPLLRVDNNHADGKAARFEVTPGNAPFTVNSVAKVPLLNSDRLDGSHARAFLRKADYDANRDGRVDVAETVMGLGPDDLVGPEGPQGPQGPPGEPTGYATFDANMDTDQEEVVLATSGPLTLKAICTVASPANSDYVTFTMTGAEEGWFMSNSTAPRAAGEEVTVGVTNTATHSSRETRMYTTGPSTGAWSPDGSVMSFEVVSVRFHLGGHECGVSGVAYFIESTP